MNFKEFEKNLLKTDENSKTLQVLRGYTRSQKNENDLQTGIVDLESLNYQLGDE